MWLWGACVCALVGTAMVGAAEDDGDYTNTTDEDLQQDDGLHQAWNKLVKSLLGKDYGGEDPWRDSPLEPGYQADQPEPMERELSVNSLKGLNEEEIWEKVIGDDRPKGGENKPIEEGPREYRTRSTGSEFTDSTPTLSEQKVTQVGDDPRSTDGDSYLKYPSAPEVSREDSARVLDSLLSQQPLNDATSDRAGPGAGAATLAFVFDTTGSMWDDLQQVRYGAAQIMDTMLQRPDKPVYDYVLVPFHDPLIGPVTVTTDHKLLMQRLNEIQIYGGGDCPEASVEAVRQALQFSRPNSYIYVFTDASAKDYRLITQVLSLIQRKQSQVVFVMTGDCGDQTHPGYQVYHKIAATSSGQVYHLNKSDVDEVLSFVRVSLQSRKVNLLSVERPAAQNGSGLELAIDQSLKEFTVSVSGPNASIGVVDPGGQEIHPPQLTPLLDLQNVKVVNVKEPPPGVWILQVGSDASHTVRSTGLSGSDFIHGFSVIPTTNMAETYHRPLKSGLNSVLIRATEPDNLYNLTKLELVHLNGSVAQTVAVCAVPGQPGLYTGGPFTPPDHFFYLSVSGFGKDGYPVKRITATAISAQTPELPTLSMAPSYSGSTGQVLRLVCRVESLVPFTVRWFKDSAVKTKFIRYNQTAEVIYEIKAAQKSDAGRYVCKVTIPNIPGSVYKDTKVNILAPPAQVVTEKEVISIVGTTTELKCSVMTEVEYNVSWHRLQTARSSGEAGTHPILLPMSECPRAEILNNNSLLLHSTELADQGWYICTAQNKGGQAAGRVYLVLHEPPTIRVSPPRQEFTGGSHLDIHCHILAGIPSPSITWTKNNVTIEGIEEKHNNTHWTLHLNNLRKEDEGSYYCEGRNNAGFVGATAELVYVEPPRVEAEDHSPLVRQGDTAVLTCHVTAGVPTPLITWYKHFRPLATHEHSRHKILDGGQLKIEKINEGDTGEYLCVARNSAGEARDTVELQVGSLPRVVHFPTDLSVPIGGSGSMLCAAIGNPVPQTSWSKGGAPLPSHKIFVSGQGELFIKDAQIEDEGNYTCTVENLFGKSSYHVGVKITGIVAPLVMAESLPPEMNVLAGRSVQLPCPVLQGHPPPTRQWFKDDTPLPTQLSSDGGLLLSNISVEDAGQYKCVVSNVGGQDTLVTSITILEPPRVLLSEWESEVKAVEGGAVTLPCPVSGRPPPSVTWLRHGKRIVQSLENSTSLQLANLTVQQAGTYTCLAISPAGSDSRSTTLHVLVPPKISKWKDNVTVSEGHLVRLECVVTSIPPANMSWYHNQQQLPYHSNVIRFFVNKTSEGQYKCIAENEVGSSTEIINLSVSVVPRIDPATPTKLVSVTGEKVILMCPASGDPKPSISWSKLGEPLTRLINEDGSLVLTDLKPADAGTYVCTVTNIAGSAVLPVSLDVMERPVIVEWGQDGETDVSVVEGEVLTLSCVAEGRPTPSITWLKGRQLTHGPHLRLMAMQEDEGNYTCVAENNVGHDEQTVSLIVLVGAYIISGSGSEESVQLLSGSSETSLTCQVGGKPHPTVSWFKDSVNLTNNDNPNLRVEDNVLTFINATQDFAGLYLCHAENVAGLAQEIFTVHFYEPPTILDPSATNITLREGDDYTLPCSAGGVPAPTVHWLRQDRVLPVGYQDEEMVVLQDNVLVLTQVTKAAEGQYSCMAVGPTEQVSKNYSVHVIVPPAAVDTAVQQVDIVDSTNGLLTCPVEHGSSPAAIQWLKDGAPISFASERADDVHFNVQDGGKSLKIVEASSDDGGLYTCVATNLAGRSQASFAVDVLVHPHFIDEFPEKEFIKLEGEKLVLDCRAGGNPEPKVSWRRVELGLPVTQHTAPGVMLELPNRHRLIIPGVRPHHAGTYQCTAANRLGRDTRIFSLQVIAPPEVEGRLEESVETSANETVVLQCRVWGSPAPTVVWHHRQHNNNNGSIDFTEVRNDGISPGQLELRDVSPSQAGIYRCTAANNLGSVSKIFNVTISEPARIARSELVEEVLLRLGSELVLRCDITGAPPPTVSWLHNGHLLANAHTHELRAGPANISSGGKYTCVASNTAGIMEKHFKIKVLVPPRISESNEFNEDVGMVVVEGLPLTIRCPVTASPSPSPLPEISWFKDGQRLNETERFIAVPAATLKDRGNYTCTATNDVGSVSKTFLVEIHVVPKLRDPSGLTELEVLSKSRVALNCSVSGSPPPSVLWLRGTEPLAQPTLADANQTLIIGSIGLEQSGHYSCLASNIVGSVEKSFIINVIEAPSVMGDEASELSGGGVGGVLEQRVVLHRRMVLDCPVSGAPRPNITWYKDGVLLTGQLVSADGRSLHVLNTLAQHAGNYSCVASNQAGTTQLFLPVYVIVPLQWGDWTAWSACSKSCGGGKEVRNRQCGPRSHQHAVSDFVQFNTSDCVGDKIQSRPCNVLPCQIHGGWSEWTAWTSCSESCGAGTRRRYRQCDSPHPAFGGNTCPGHDGQQEPCIIEACLVQSQWGQWTEWSRCSAKCGVGTQLRARHCIRGDEVANDCDGPNKEVISCSVRKCPVNGKWSAWGPWSECSVSCGRGRRQRHRLCSRHLYGGKPCSGDNIQIEACLMAQCVADSESVQPVALHIRGQLNGERVEDMYLDAALQQHGPRQSVTATLDDILRDQANWFPYLTFLIPTLPWDSSAEKGNVNKFTEESKYQFATGQELVVKHRGRTMEPSGSLSLDIEVVGEVPILQPTSSVVIHPYTEDYIKTGPNSLYTSSRSSINSDGQILPYAWNRTVTYDTLQDSTPYLVERLSTDEGASEYNSENQKFNFKQTSEISKKYKYNKCPVGYKLDSTFDHCADIDECYESDDACHHTQSCVNLFGSYRCQCQQGYRLSSNRMYCVDVDECVEASKQPCAYRCHNTPGSFHCSCPPELALANDRRTCIAWGELDYDESLEENYNVIKDVRSSGEYLEAVGQESVACRPGLEWQDGSCRDIDECSEEEVCGEEEICLNTQGSFHCLSTPCVKAKWNQSSRSCVKECAKLSSGCSKGATVAEIVIGKTIRLNTSILQPYEDLTQLQPTGLRGEPLSRSFYTIVDNPQAIPLRIRIEKGRGVVYVMKYFQIDSIQRVVIKASSFSKDYKVLLYTTNFILFLYSEQ